MHLLNCLSECQTLLRDKYLFLLCACEDFVSTDLQKTHANSKFQALKRHYQMLDSIF